MAIYQHFYCIKDLRRSNFHPKLSIFYYIFRFAVQLLAPSAVAAKIAGRNNITVEDIKDIGELFLDAKSSAIMLEANADKYMK